MGEDTYIYDIRINAGEAESAVTEHISEANENERMGVEIREKREHNGDLIYTVATQGDVWEILVFLEGFSKIESAELL